MPNQDFGLESMVRLQPLSTSRDALILLTHFVLTKNGLLFAGRGNVWSEEDTPSESLPADWAQSTEVYRYVNNASSEKKYVVKFVEHEKFLIVSMVSVKTESAISMNMNVEAEVRADELSTQESRKIFVNAVRLINEIEEKLISTCETNTRSVSTATDAQRPQPSPYNEPSRGYPDYSDPLRVPTRNPVFLGRRDLDPFAIGGGGMIVGPGRYDPSRPDLGIPGPEGIPLPRGAVPPGARFDPFGPPFGPDPDNNEFLPPGMYSRRDPPGGGYI